jgi:hypothetical protein
LTEAQRVKLAEIEPQLRACVARAEFSRAKSLVAEIQPMLRSTGHTTRLLQIKNWLYECALEAREYHFATLGLEGNRKIAGHGTRIYLEAICVRELVAACGNILELQVAVALNFRAAHCQSSQSTHLDYSEQASPLL